MKKIAVLILNRNLPKITDQLYKMIKKNNKNDWIIYSDSDEIPNLEFFNLKDCRKKIVLFNQKLFYYKFNFTINKSKSVFSEF